jgi:hypothetical protein
MSIDLSVYVGERREQLIKLGDAVGSVPVQQCADGFAIALASHAPKLYTLGYVDADGAFLGALCAESKRLCIARPEIVRGKTAARSALRREVKEAKALRMDQRAALDATLSAEQDKLPPAVLAAARLVLRDTESAGADADALKLQLLALATIFEHADLAAPLAERNASGAAAALRAQAARVDAADAASHVGRGATHQTAEIDLIDGLMIERLRAIRKIARRAAVRLGDPSIAAAFSLDALD